MEAKVNNRNLVYLLCLSLACWALGSSIQSLQAQTQDELSACATVDAVANQVFTRVLGFEEVSSVEHTLISLYVSDSSIDLTADFQYAVKETVNGPTRAFTGTASYLAEKPAGETMVLHVSLALEDVPSGDKLFVEYDLSAAKTGEGRCSMLEVLDVDGSIGGKPLDYSGTRDSTLDGTLEDTNLQVSWNGKVSNMHYLRTLEDQGVGALTDHIVLDGTDPTGSTSHVNALSTIMYTEDAAYLELQD